MGINFKDERWKPVDGFEGAYEVSNMGRVRSLPRTRLVRSINGTERRVPARRHAIFLSQKLTTQGYFEVCLRHNRRQRMAYVQRLVCEAFHGHPPTKKAHAAHLNGLRTDNREENLVWTTANENAEHKTKYENHQKHQSSRYPGQVNPERRRAAQLLLANGMTIPMVKRCLGMATRTVEKIAARLTPASTTDAA